MNLTHAQRTAVYYPAGELILSAAAGSGKTASLTARIAGLIAHGEDMGLSSDEVPTLDKMLVVTFTRAAAGEMKARISKMLSSIASSPDSDATVRGRVDAALARLPSAEISTIHSFLYSALSPYFPAMGISPDVRFIEEKAGYELKRAQMQLTCDRFFEDEASADISSDEINSPGTKASFDELCDVFARAKDSTRLDNALLRIADALSSAGLEFSSLSDFADEMDSAEGDILTTPAGECVADYMRSLAEHFTRKFGDLRERFGEDYRALWLSYKKTRKDKDTVNRYADNMDAVFAAVDELSDIARDARYERYREFLQRAGEVFDFAAGRAKYNPDEELYSLYRTVRSEAREKLAAAYKNYFIFTEDEIRVSRIRSARVLRRAAEVLVDYGERVTRKKRELSVIDYDDMSRLALKLLIDENGEPTAAAHEIGKRYRYIFIDEFQDTDSVQDRIFRALSCEGAVRFMVGDIKQSIYGFRGAEPEVFGRYRSTWNRIDAETGAPKPDENGRIPPSSLFMSENFRSSEPVIRLCNRVFDLVMPFGDTGYMEGDSLVYGRKDIDADGNALIPPRSEVVLVDADTSFGFVSRETEGGDAEEDNSNNPSDNSANNSTNNSNNPSDNSAVKYADAEYIAARISAMLGKPDFKGRIIHEEDIAIILRAPSSDGIYYREALARRGIAAMLASDRRLGSYPSVLLMLCLIGAADNPSRDEYLIGALHSPVFGFTAGEVAQMHGAAGRMPLYAGLEAISLRGDDDELTLRAAECVKTLTEWSIRARAMRADRFIEYLIDATDFFSIEGIGDNAAESDALNRLCSLAAVYERDIGGGFGGVAGFAEYAADAVESGSGADKEKSASRVSGSVSIVSVHGSKGLQYPVVFVAHCDKKRNTLSESENVMFSPAAGFGFSIPDESGLAMCGTFMKSALTLKLRQREISEEMRNLYVAMTRAEDLLIVTANYKFRTSGTNKLSEEDQLSKYLETSADAAGEMDRYYIAHHDRWIDWVLPASADGMRPVPSSVSVDDGVCNASPVCELYEMKDGNIVRVVHDPEGDIADAEESSEEETDSVVTNDGETAAEGENEIPADVLAPFIESFGYEYPYLYLADVPSKLVVSRLSPELLDPESDVMTDAVMTAVTAAVTALTDAVTAKAVTVLTAVPVSLTEEIAEEPYEGSEVGDLPDVTEERAAAELKRPKFMETVGEDDGHGREDGAARGSAVHMFMQFADFSRLEADGAAAELERLCAEGFISRSSAELIDISELELFRASALFSKLLRSTFVKREFRFNVRLPAAEFTTDSELKRKFIENGDMLTVQGVVDCVYRDPDTGELILVDYKTDRLTQREKDNPRLAAWVLRKRHSVQLAYYRRICAEMFGEEISAAEIYSTVMGEVVEIRNSELR